MQVFQKQSLHELYNQLIPENITHDDFLDVDDRLTVTEAIMSDKVIIQDLLEAEIANKNEENDIVKNKSLSPKLQN